MVDDWVQIKFLESVKVKVAGEGICKSRKNFQTKRNNYEWIYKEEIFNSQKQGPKKHVAKLDANFELQNWFWDAIYPSLEGSGKFLALSQL